MRKGERTFTQLQCPLYILVSVPPTTANNLLVRVFGKLSQNILVAHRKHAHILFRVQCRLPKQTDQRITARSRVVDDVQAQVICRPAWLKPHCLQLAISERLALARSLSVVDKGLEKRRQAWVARNANRVQHGIKRSSSVRQCRIRLIAGRHDRGCKRPLISSSRPITFETQGEQVDIGTEACQGLLVAAVGVRNANANVGLGGIPQN